MKSVNEILGKHAESGEVLDIQSLWFRFTIDSASDFLFGKNVDSLHDETSQFAKHFNYVQDVSNNGKWTCLIYRSNPNVQEWVICGLGL